MIQHGPTQQKYVRQNWSLDQSCPWAASASSSMRPTSHHIARFHLWPCRSWCSYRNRPCCLRCCSDSLGCRRTATIRVLIRCHFNTVACTRATRVLDDVSQTVTSIGRRACLKCLPLCRDELQRCARDFDICHVVGDVYREPLRKERRLGDQVRGRLLCVKRCAAAPYHKR